MFYSAFGFLLFVMPRQEDLAKAVEKFTLSCAGYCVATYVLVSAECNQFNYMNAIASGNLLPGVAILPKHD